MYVVAGVTGRVGSATAQNLLAAGAPTRVLVRRETDAAAWLERGAEAAIAALEDRAALAAALEGSEGLFVLLPFDLGADDLNAHADRLIESISGAVADARVPHVVMLSSVGAQLESGTGPITGLHRLEKALLATGTTLTALRSGHFQEKVSDVLEMARETGTYPVFASSANVAYPQTATADLGEVAALALQSPPPRSETVAVLGPSYTEQQVADILANALDKPLTVATVPQDAWAGAFIDAGFKPHIAKSLAELYDADERGLLAPEGDRQVNAPTPLDQTIGRLVGA